MPKKKEEEPMNVPISYLPVLEEPKKKTGVSIAPIQYSKLTDLELERVIRYELKKNPHLIKRHGRILNVKYDVVEKNVHGPKIVNKKHVSKLRVEDEWYEQRRPNVFTYSPDDKKVRAKLPEFTFKKARKERTPSPNF